MRGRAGMRDEAGEEATEAVTPARVTLDDVATTAGVSRAAASLALRGKPGVAEGTRQRILDVAGELGYRIRALPTSSVSGGIGLLVKSKPVDVGSTNAFYAPVIAGISRACADLELDLRLDGLAVDERFDPIEVPRMIQATDIDGLIILGAYLSARTADLLGGQPLVLVDGYAEDPAAFPSVLSDNVGGAAQATRHLIGLGHSRIAMVGSTPTSFPSILGRRKGYTEAMTAAGLEPRYVDAAHDEGEQCQRGVSELLARDPGVTALVASNDFVALTLLGELRDQVPGRLSLVGFDDIEAAGMVRPQLTTVAIDKQAMGRLAVSLLRHRIANPDDPSFTAVERAQLVVRGSTAPPR